MKQFESQDVVRIISGQNIGKTAVVNRHPENEPMVNLFFKGCHFGIWYFAIDLKKIGSTKRKNLTKGML